MASDMDRTFSTSRALAATPAEVFAAIADPARLSRWWGPKGFTNHFNTFEFKPGGDWVFTMQGPDGQRYPNAAVFDAIEPAQRVVVRHASPPEFTLTITLEATNGGTLLGWRQVFDDAAVARAVAHIVEPANEQNLDRLGAELGLAATTKATP